MKSNILLIGNSGAGKSTLINATIGNEEAYTRKGEGVTQKLKSYSNDELPFQLIDTMGFEPSFLRKNKAINQVKKWSKESEKEEDKQIHLIWFCVEGTRGRLFPDTIKNLIKATKIWKSVPVIVVITKSISKPENNENIKMVTESFNKYSNDGNKLKGVVPVVAKEYKIDDKTSILPYGIEELIELSNSILPEGRQASKNDIAEYKLGRKRIFAHSLVSASVTSAAAIGAVPIPFADAAILVPLETGMLVSIAKIYGIKNDEKSSVFIKTIVDTGTISVTAKALISALKAIPGINIGASVLNAIIAGIIVATIGEASIYAYEQVYLGNKSLNDVNWIQNIIEKALSSNEILETVKNILKNIGKEKKITPTKIVAITIKNLKSSKKRSK